MTPLQEGAALRAPALTRRLACAVSELVLLFGVVMFAGYFYSSLTQQRNAAVGRHGLMAFLFVVLAIYFVWFWSHGGQTVAMKAWHLRLVDRAGQPVSQARALLRYVLSYLWLLPSLAFLAVSDRGHTLGSIFGALGINIVVWAALSRLHPLHQFWHDAIAGTRLIDWRPARQRN